MFPLVPLHKCVVCWESVAFPRRTAAAKNRSTVGEVMARILVIDDEDPIRSLLRRSLQPLGHEIVEAPDGSVGTRLFESSHFDLVITDLFMPEKDGIETVLDLRERYPEVKILVVSGGIPSGGESLDRSGPLADAEAFGADASLEKPFEIRELIEVVSELLSRT